MKLVPWHKLPQHEKDVILREIPNGSVEVWCPWWAPNHWEEKCNNHMVDVCVYRIKPITIGDYVLASAYSDCDPNDPWCVGFVVRIVDNPVTSPAGVINTVNTYVIGDANGNAYPREYRCCKRITKEQGEAWLAEHNAQTYE